MSGANHLRTLVVLVLIGCAGTPKEPEPAAAPAASQLTESARKKRPVTARPSVLAPLVIYQVVDLTDKQLGFAFAEQMDDDIQRQSWILDDVPPGQALRGPFRLLPQRALSLSDGRGGSVAVGNLRDFDAFAQLRYTQRPVGTPLYVRVVARAWKDIPIPLPTDVPNVVAEFLEARAFPSFYVAPSDRQLDDGTVGIFRDPLTLTGLASSVASGDTAVEKFFLAPGYTTKDLGKVKFLELSRAAFDGQYAQEETLAAIAGRKWFLVDAWVRFWSDADPLPQPIKP